MCILHSQTPKQALWCFHPYGTPIPSGPRGTVLSSVTLLLPCPAPGMRSQSYYKPCLWTPQSSALVCLHLPASCTPLACPRSLPVVSAAPSGHQISCFPRVSISFLSLPCPKQIGAPGHFYPAGMSHLASRCCTACEIFDNVGKLASDELAVLPLWCPPAGAR